MLKTATKNKPILVLVLGCLPLAGLTVASFAGIGNLASRFPSIEDGDLIPAGANVSVLSADDLEDDEILRTAVATREFLAGEPLPDRALQTDPVFLAALAADWKKWSDATELVDAVLALEEDVRGAGASQLKLAVKRIDTILEECRSKDPAGSARLARVLQRRKEELLTRIAFLEKCEDASDLLAEAKAAYDARDFFVAYKKYDTLLTQYDDVLASGALDGISYATITAARQDAAFWRDLGYLHLASPVSEQPSKQRELLVGFLDSYRGMEGEAAAEKLKSVESKLQSVDAELRRLEMNEAAVQPISTLGRYDGRFAEGVAAAARIAETYPTDWVRSQLQDRVTLWLKQVLPPKRFNEPDGIEEVETNSGNVVRGFFEPVNDAAGGVIGYKSYPTSEERENPTRNVGRYPAADLRGVPNLSVPRQCVDAYMSARANLLADAGNRTCWTAFKRTCDSAEVMLVDYRRKPGSSREPLFFDDASEFAKMVLASDVWRYIETIWGK